MNAQYRPLRIEIYYRYSEREVAMLVANILETKFLYHTEYIEEPIRENTRGVRVLSCDMLESIKEIKEDYYKAKKEVLNKCVK